MTVKRLLKKYVITFIDIHIHAVNTLVKIYCDHVDNASSVYNSALRLMEL